MDPRLLITIIELLCPLLREMAARTDNPVDDAIVNVLCALTSPSPGTKPK